MRQLVVKSILALMIMHSHSAMAANTIVQLKTPKKSPIKSIGVVPVKKHVPLQLGSIRNDEPELPTISTLKSRMKKRLRMAHQRQRSVSSAKRSRNAGELRRTAKPKRSFKPSPNDSRISEEQPDGLFDHPTPFKN